MGAGNKLFFSFLAGAAVGMVAASLISKEDREKMANQLKVKASAIREKLAEELAELHRTTNAANKS